MNNSIKREFYYNLRNIDNYREVCEKESICIQHGNTTVLRHSRNVAYYSMVLAKQIEKKFNIKFDYYNLIVGAFLHDFFIYDWHIKNSEHRLHGYTHPSTARNNAVKICNIKDEKVLDIIKTHMWPLTLTKIPTTKEAFIVCMVDKYLALSETFGRNNKD